MDWLDNLLSLYPDDGNWSKRRRQIILARWPDSALRAAEQDARAGKGDDLTRYDAEVAAIKAAVPKS